MTNSYSRVPVGCRLSASEIHDKSMFGFVLGRARKRDAGLFATDVRCQLVEQQLPVVLNVCHCRSHNLLNVVAVSAGCAANNAAFGVSVTNPAQLSSAIPAENVSVGAVYGH